MHDAVHSLQKYAAAQALVGAAVVFVVALILLGAITGLRRIVVGRVSRARPPEDEDEKTPLYRFLQNAAMALFAIAALVYVGILPKTWLLPIELPDTIPWWVVWLGWGVSAVIAIRILGVLMNFIGTLVTLIVTLIGNARKARRAPVLRRRADVDRFSYYQRIVRQRLAGGPKISS
jgi:Na+-transporting methylmalonyl-CoA/oxaloacetate decarboxylase gamma subunit